MTEFSEVKDSGQRQEFDTGSKRDTSIGKGRFDLISPIALKRLAQHYENGARKYGDRNWEKGQPLSRYIESAQRHLNNVLLGMTDEDHLAAAAWNVFAIIHTQELIRLGHLPESLDNLPHTDLTQPMKRNWHHMCKKCGHTWPLPDEHDFVRCPQCGEVKKGTE